MPVGLTYYIISDTQGSGYVNVMIVCDKENVRKGHETFKIKTYHQTAMKNVGHGMAISL